MHPSLRLLFSRENIDYKIQFYGELDRKLFLSFKHYGKDQRKNELFLEATYTNSPCSARSNNFYFIKTKNNTPRLNTSKSIWRFNFFCIAENTERHEGILKS